MLKFLSIVLIGIALAAVAVVAYASMLPDDFRIQRSARINAPADAIFPRINSLKAFDEWNPFVKRDPAIKVAYSGPDSGPGAKSTWDSTGSAGAGSLTITDSSAPSKIAMKLDMLKPIAASNDIQFTIAPADGGSDVTWEMSGKRPLIGKVISVFMSMDRMVGGEFESGLAELKRQSERGG